MIIIGILFFIFGFVNDIGQYATTGDTVQTIFSGTKGMTGICMLMLLDQGLIHKIERLSAFVGCVAGCSDNGTHMSPSS